MKNKKHHHEKEISNLYHNRSHNKSQGLSKRVKAVSNKENILQITEPLDTQPSKEFVLSRQSNAHGSRSSLKDISCNKNIAKPLSTTDLTKVEADKTQAIFDRRLSLKCTANHSQQLEYQQSQRLSMAAPLRRQSFIQNNYGADEKDTNSSFYRNSLCSDSKSKHTIKKEAIISNLVHKLEHEEDLRQIIELKLKNGMNASCQLPKDKRNQSYLTDFTEQNSHQSMASKLRQCENEISYFKTIVKEMSQKIVELTEERRFAKKKVNVGEYEQSKTDNQVLSLLKSVGRGSHCNCQKKITKQIAVQATIGTEVLSSRQKWDSSSDFMDNLQKTLKVLDRKQ